MTLILSGLSRYPSHNVRDIEGVLEVTRNTGNLLLNSLKLCKSLLGSPVISDGVHWCPEIIRDVQRLNNPLIEHIYLMMELTLTENGS